MPQGQRQQQQRQPPTATAQIQSIIFQTLTAQTGPLTGWQAGVLPNERMGLILNIIGNLRLASQHQPNPPPLQRMIEIGIRFEKEIFEKSLNKDIYKQEVAMKLEQLLERRNQQQAGLQQQINQQAQNQAMLAQQNAQQQSQAQQMMMMNQQSNMQGQRPMPQQSNQQPFSHLQHQMQASPIPGQPPQAPMGMPNQGLPQNMTQNQQQQFQVNLEQQRTQQNAPGRPGGMPQQQLSAQDNAMVQELALRLMSQVSEEEKITLRNTLSQRIDPILLNRYQTQGVDPLIQYYRNQALNRLRSDKQARMQQQLAMGQQPQNMPPTAPPMQQQRSVNPSPLAGQAPPPTSMGGNPDFGSFMGNMGDLAAQQQQQGVIAEQAGQMVVPASGAPRNTTPQPGAMAGQPNNLNDQRNITNPNARAQQQQQQILQMQQQQQRLHQSLQQQSQVQARLNAQNKAQQMGLQGQPGGMGPGPVPPQQSPAMATLNAPMRTPSQQMSHPETAQVNNNARFGTPLDPRFMQGNQKQAGPGNGMGIAGINPAIFNSMAPEQQQQMAALPPEKLHEVVSKWNMQNGRPQMPMQGNPQARPGQQMPQPGQFNPQNAVNQFANQNGGQRGPPSMVTSMNTAQQMALQQQMANMRPNQMQQRNLPPGQEQQQLALQMDNAQIPAQLHNHVQMPQGIPPEIKKWGQLKQWTAQNAQNLGLPPNALESVRQLQSLHYRQILTMKRQQQAAGSMQPGAQNAQTNNNPTIPPGMAAPVAPMGPNPGQMQNAMNMGIAGQVRQPTPQEIHNIRNHPSGKMAGLNDDQIRTILLRNFQAQVAQQSQLTPQQQQQQRAQMMQQMQLQQRLQQASAQQKHQANQPQPQAKPAPIAPPKQAPQATQTPETAASTANNTNTTRNSRPQQNASARNQAQNSSPAQPAKNLKRASSDDVVEVPNPNAQQARPTQPPTQNGNQQPQMRNPLTPVQIAGLNPEQRKKYELMLQSAQANIAARTMQVDPAMSEKLEAIKKEARESHRDFAQNIPMDEETRKTTALKIQQIVGPLTNVGKILSRWFQITSDEETARKYCKIRLRIMGQFKDPEMKILKDGFSITGQDLDNARTMMHTMVQDLSVRFPKMMKLDPAKAQPGTMQAAQSALQQTPLNAANLQQQQQQLMKNHQRNNSRSSHVPAAPTSSQPPFQFGASSPHGLPQYGTSTKITQENLHIPARKKQKQNGTPGSTASPQVAKAPSPEMKRQGEPKPQPKSSLCCLEPDCDRHNVGFESEEALRLHNREEHEKPLEDPTKFATEEFALALGLDSQGQTKKPNPSPSQAPAAGGAVMTLSGSKQGQTPNIKAESASAAATPMNRQVSMNRQGSATDGKPNMHAKSNLAKDASAKLQSVQNTAKTPAPQEVVHQDAWANSTLDPHDLANIFAPFETGAGGAISDMNVYRSITPNDTPESSKDGISEPNSDISEGAALDIDLHVFDDTWMPFGPRDIDNLIDMNQFNVSSGGEEDIAMFDEAAAVNHSWDDFIDSAALDKPFAFDTSFYYMKAD